MLTMNQRGLVRTSISDTEPLTLAETKLYLRIDGNSQDSLITDLITVAREHAEQFLKKSLIGQQWTLSLDSYAPIYIRLPMGPVQSITSISAIDSQGNSTLVNSENYMLRAGRDELELGEIIYAHTIQIVYETGYADIEDIPTSVRYGMLSHIAALYECRGEMTTLPADARALYTPHKEVLL